MGWGTGVAYGFFIAAGLFLGGLAGWFLSGGNLVAAVAVAVIGGYLGNRCLPKLS
jgi:hypothetical protein